ncbi:hypothetical protein AOLI_G00098460 [Acnodon oligacanthus]
MLGLMIQDAHGLPNVARQRKEEVKERLDEQKRSTVQPGDKVFVKVFRRKCEEYSNLLLNYSIEHENSDWFFVLMILDGEPSPGFD